MKSFVKWMDNLPLWAKILLALPGIDVVWAVYRVLKGAAYGKTEVLVAGIIWILLGWAILWIVDIVSVCLYKHPKLFA